MASSDVDESVVKVDKYRSHMYGEGEKYTKWRFGAPPNYDLVDRLFEEGRTQEWSKGSLEEKVQNLVKTWEMEIIHKISPEDYKSINVEKFTFSVNGGKPMSRSETSKLGSYNLFLQTSMPKHLLEYDPSVEMPESSQQVFVATFPRGFALEILQVYSGPPAIVYKFRHWAFMEGPFKGHAPTGEKVDESMRIEKVEFFYDPNKLLASLIKNPSSNETGASNNPSPGCPIFNNI